MSFANTNLVAVSNGNNNNNVITASNGNKFIAAISGNQGPFTGAKFFKGATPGTIKKPSARVASMKITIGFDGFTGVNAQVSKPSSPLRNKLFLASKPRIAHAPMFGSNEPSNRLESQFQMNQPPNSLFPPPPMAMVAAQSIWQMHDKPITWLM